MYVSRHLPSVLSFKFPASNSRHCSSTHVDAVATGVVLTKYDMARRVLAVYQSDSPNYSGYQDYVKSVAIVSQISKYVKMIRGAFRLIMEKKILHLFLHTQIHLGLVVPQSLSPPILGHESGSSLLRGTR